MKAHYAANEKANEAELNVTECWANISLLMSPVEGTPTIKDEMKDSKANLKELEVTFSDSLGAVPPINLCDVTLLPTQS